MVHCQNIVRCDSFALLLLFSRFMNSNHLGKLLYPKLLRVVLKKAPTRPCFAWNQEFQLCSSRYSSFCWQLHHPLCSILDKSKSNIDIHPREHVSVFGTVKQGPFNISLSLHKLDFITKRTPMMLSLDEAFAHGTLPEQRDVAIVVIDRPGNRQYHRQALENRAVWIHFVLSGDSISFPAIPVWCALP